MWVAMVVTQLARTVIWTWASKCLVVRHAANLFCGPRDAACNHNNTDEHEVNTLLCPTLRCKLTPRPSPLLANVRACALYHMHTVLHTAPQNNHGGGFVDDHDRVSMIVRKFANPQSAGCSR